MYLKDKDCTLRVRVSDEQYKKLGSLAANAGVTVSDLVRQLIDNL